MHKLLLGTSQLMLRNLGDSGSILSRMMEKIIHFSESQSGFSFCIYHQESGVYAIHVYHLHHHRKIAAISVYNYYIIIGDTYLYWQTSNRQL